MPWTTPTLREVRSLVRDAVNASLPGADANVPNSLLRVMSDNQGALCHLTLQYIDWLSLQLLPDTAETEWLDRHGKIWLVNADGSTGRKMASLASGIASFQGMVDGAVVPTGTQLQSAAEMPVGSISPNPDDYLRDACRHRYLVLEHGRWPDPRYRSWRLRQSAGRHIAVHRGADRWRELGRIARNLAGGTDAETDEQLRSRILQRIQNVPMGGSAADYVNWALAVPGVTRAWAAPEQGPGTITVRFLMDDLARRR